MVEAKRSVFHEITEGEAIFVEKELTTQREMFYYLHLICD
jgi:hypothetical protein